MEVRNHMSAPPIAITGDTDFKTALGLMEKHRIRRLPVVDVDGVIAGIVVERDLLIAADRYLNSPVDVARIMTRQVVTVRTATPVIDAATLMTERKIRWPPGRRYVRKAPGHHHRDRSASCARRVVAANSAEPAGGGAISP